MEDTITPNTHHTSLITRAQHRYDKHCNLNIDVLKDSWFFLEIKQKEKKIIMSMYLCNPRAGGKERKEENLSRKGMI